MVNIINQLKDSLDWMYGPTIFILKVVGVIIVSAIMVKIGGLIIGKVFEKRKSFRHFSDSRKIDTVATLVISIYRYAIYAIAVVVFFGDVLSLKSVIAAAGIGGVAIGFGAQSLIKDIISGFFIIVEDQYAVGDTVTIDSMTGTVEEMELRVTKIRNYNGDLHIIPNGEIKKVTNHTRGNRAAIVDIPLAYSVDIDKAISTAERVCAIVEKEFDNFVEKPEVLGVTDLGKDGLTLRIVAKTLPDGQWEVERRIRKLIKETFSSAKLEFYDKNRIILGDRLSEGDNKNG